MTTPVYEKLPCQDCGQDNSTDHQCPMPGNQQRCGHCGTADLGPDPAVVKDWRAEVICRNCESAANWADYQYDPITNVYAHL